ncbi:MAG: hypothetical protein JWO07_657 [Candidatus Saccharibacteria bacterium]|nr:hypothetical protein [Candidatus Saccharibacteria bacterium]
MTAIALFLGLGLAYFSSNLSSLFQKQENYRSYLSTANDLKTDLLNAETGQRGYIITQNDYYLKPYNHALPLIQSDLKILDDSPLSDSYRQQMKQIDSDSASKLSELKATIDTLRSQGQSAAIAIVSTNVGINDMDSLRALIMGITDAQNTQLQSEIKTAELQTDILKFLAPVVGILDIGLIVTILYLTRKAIRREQQLENLKEQFVALASHQLRTPATAVKQYLSLLISGAFGKMKKEQTDILKKINDSNDRGIKIANNLLNVTIADSGKVTISENPVDLSQLLKHVLTHYIDALKESRSQNVILKMPKNAIFSRVDPFQIRLIYENLIENASKYSADHKRIYVTLQASPTWITFSVKDSGIGISKKDIPLLFKKFSRLDQAARRAEGSGLGLYLVKQAAELHGGEVNVLSIAGKGSTFTVRIKRLK